MNIENIENYCSFFDRLFPAFGNALDSVGKTFEFKGFLETALDNVNSTVEELKEDIENVVIKRKKFVKVDFADEIITFIYSTLINLQL